jgi:hypothetical protein
MATTTLLTPRNTVRPMLDPTSALNLAAFYGDVMVDLEELNASLAAIHAQLDGDGTVADTDYNSNDPAAVTSLPSVIDGPRGLGASQGLDTEYHAFTATVLADMTAIRAAVVALTAKLDADTGVTDADYNSEDPAALTVAADTFSDFETRNSVTPFPLVADYASVRTFSGQAAADITANRAAIVAITAKLDLDIGVALTTYAANCNPAAQQSAALTAS